VVCKEACGRPKDCWSVGPEVLEGNREVWALYQRFESDWHWGMAGYRIRYDRVPVMLLILHQGDDGPDMDDVVDRLKIIESAILEIESKRYEAAERKRKHEETRPNLIVAGR
jgi:hypothetical protein